MADEQDDIHDCKIITVDFTNRTETVIAHEYGACRHGAYQLNKEQHVVNCGVCGALLDPFTILMEYATRERNWRFYDAELRRARKAMLEIAIEEKRIKARTRGAARKDADAAVALERKRDEETRRRVAGNARQIRELAERIERAARIDD
jgi:hypothetical protein